MARAVRRPPKGQFSLTIWATGGAAAATALTRQAYAWDAARAAQALQEIAHKTTPVTYPVVFMDIELPGHAPSFTPADDNGWTNVYTSPCSGRISASHIASRVDRAELNGSAAYLGEHSADKAGVYSSPGI